MAARAHLGADFILGGSGHNAGIVNPPAANKHGYWTNARAARGRHGMARHRDAARRQLVAVVDRNGSTSTATEKTVAARQPKDPIEPAPGRYAMMP